METDTLTSVEKRVKTPPFPSGSTGPTEPGTKPSRWRWLVWVVVLSALTYSGVRYRDALASIVRRPAATDSASGARGGRGGNANPRGTSVVAMPARKADMPIYLRGLGSVAAFNTVTVRSRVDGELINIAFTEGQFVREGDLLAEIDRRPFEVQLSQAKGQLDRDEALLREAKLELERYQLLSNDGLIPRQQFDAQTASVGQYEGAIKADQAQIDSANLQISYSRILAPISGQVGLRLVDRGNMVRASDQTGIVVITQLQPISVLFNIPEDNLSAVLKKLHAGVTLRVEAYDRDDKVKIATGTLQTVDNQIDQNTGTSRLKAVFDNKDNALFPNQFVNVHMLLETDRGATIIPAAAVQRGPQGTYVYIVNSDHRAQIRPITIKNTEGSDASIASGVQPDELVVIEGTDKVQDGGRVDLQNESGNASPDSGEDPVPGPQTKGREGRGNRRGGQGRGTER